jgi:hypothetical protein
MFFFGCILQDWTLEWYLVDGMLVVFAGSVGVVVELVI